MTATALMSADYAAVFEAERSRTYPVVDAFEARCGFALGRERLESAARILACPLKAHAPNWQHGRVLYAIGRRYLVERGQPVLFLDIGTAKGFSALCLQWAIEDAHAEGEVISLDVIDPLGTPRRNSVLELDGPKSLADFLEPWQSTAEQIRFLRSTGIEWLRGHQGRVHLAFVDGKHSEAVVRQEIALLALRQQPGDFVLFDDLQIAGVAAAVTQAATKYEITTIELMPGRGYAWGVRRG